MSAAETRRGDAQMTTPLMIQIAIHYYVTAEEAGDFRAKEGMSKAPAVVEQSKALVEAGILREAYGVCRVYEATDAARVWIGALCGVPFPVQRWVMPDKDASDG